MRIAVIGGGAAGFFAAISARTHAPSAKVILLERTDRPLAKVRVSGGGRCNVTHAVGNNTELARCYPRGERFLRKAFPLWSVPETIGWFAGEGVTLKTENDGRMFPTTDDSATIIQALMGAAQRSDVELWTHCPVRGIRPEGGHFVLVLDEDRTLEVDRVIVATGGSPKEVGLNWLKDLGVAIVPPVPSLFTFNLPGDPITRLMGVVAPNARVRIEGTALAAIGPVLITHWGLSGPAVLRLSAWGARELAARAYTHKVRVNWMGPANEEEVRAILLRLGEEHPRKQLRNMPIEGIPQRLWEYLLQRAEIPPERVAAELGRKGRDRLVDLITNDAHDCKGKTTFKEEFVTAGGVALEGVDPATMESRVVPSLHFAGEVLDIDGITGGYNFQAAWTTGWIAGAAAAR